MTGGALAQPQFTVATVRGVAGDVNREAAWKLDQARVRTAASPSPQGPRVGIAATIDAGQPIRIRDMTGRVVSRDRGVIRETYLFDTLGDDTPGGLYLEQLGLRVSGPHPLLPGFFDEEAFCAIVRPLLLG
jgi:hypothetical protein